MNIFYCLVLLLCQLCFLGRKYGAARYAMAEAEVGEEAGRVKPMPWAIVFGAHGESATFIMRTSPFRSMKTALSQCGRVLLAVCL